jgi:2-C-methyl-D-erythritol 4-phosphate cytidylyltransferase
MTPRCFALIPAAGAGARAAAALPKQYVPLNGEAMLVHALRAFLNVTRIAMVQVVLAPEDAWPASEDARAICDEGGARLRFAGIGGATRARSVMAGLSALSGCARDDDWVLVHDAARPCITPRMIDRLIDALVDDPAGGLLALPVPDTVKRADPARRVEATVDRHGLWLAQTPQMFRIGMLRRAYEKHPDATDEAGAVEAAGGKPLLVEGGARNFKVTYPGDFALAGAVLRASTDDS